ncbi:ABC transporter ATP-binding protein [Oceanivirga miroungae]|uniref:ABC transporter domain-containing protein n=1 Tax=Oceanivirga miroungae TaxID=1130046 RepID=A0A6I8M6H0_9FUSO|nr:ABC transporter ATP-binding protein [Oceanivirga miroungae]VWL84963.1 hypothetical protein OMES3154_00235 [Oceanivirga miroungae]
MDSIRLKNVTKIYGDFCAINNLSFNIKKGDIVGIVGANGAGKTTLLEMMMGIRKPTKGKIELLGIDFKNNSKKVKNNIGVLLQEQCVYKDAKIIELFNFFHDLYPFSLNVEEVIEIVNLGKYINVKFKNLSGGLKQRTLLGLAIINNPEIIFLDEPTTGLDPDARRALWKSILKFKKENKTIILSSHYMDEVQKYCDEVIIIKNGNIVKKDKPINLINSVVKAKTLEDAYFYYAMGEEL